MTSSKHEIPNDSVGTSQTSVVAAPSSPRPALPRHWSQNSIMPEESSPTLYWKTCSHQGTHACAGMAWAEKSMTNLCDDCKVGNCS